MQTITDAVNTGNSQSFSYDNLQRLSQATGGYGSYGFTYDNDGNRLSQTLGGVTTTYGYGTADDLLRSESVGGVQTQAIGYTPDGRMATFSPGIQAPGGQYITSLSYNQDGRMSAVNTSGGALASYTYDGFGQRLIKTISSTTGNLYQYGLDGMLLEETDASGVAEADYVYLNGTPIATLDLATGALYFLQGDSLGTPQLATDSSQAVAWRATYQPFGTASVSGTITQNLRFPGQYFDSESGWNHNGFRDYLPELGRYAEPDPLALEYTARSFNPQTGRLLSEGPTRFAGSGSNLYGYVDDNPINSIDPSGETKIYGKWCGPDWTGGRREQYDPAHKNLYKPPDDAVDAVCQEHDMCYYRARKAFPCDKEKRQKAMTDCDWDLIKGMQSSWRTRLNPASAPIADGILLHKADPGPNDASCKCKR